MSTIPSKTIISQYGTSPTINELIQAFDSSIDTTADIDNIYSYIWDISTAQGFGLDIWGKIVGVTRYLEVPVYQLYAGFAEGDGQPFGQAPFYFAAQTSTYAISDEAYRILIMVKALANISNCTPAIYNQMLQYLFRDARSTGPMLGTTFVLGTSILGYQPASGLPASPPNRCYVVDLGNMSMQYVFEFQLTDYEIALLTQSGVLPRPAGVTATLMQTDISSTSGFAEAGIYQTFGYGVFGGQTMAVA